MGLGYISHQNCDPTDLLCDAREKQQHQKNAKLANITTVTDTFDVRLCQTYQPMRVIGLAFRLFTVS